jgi:ferric iron reductase protein FhuF
MALIIIDENNKALWWGSSNSLLSWLLEYVMERIDKDSSLHKELFDGVLYGHLEHHELSKDEKAIFNTLAKEFYSFVEKDVDSRPRETIEYTAGMSALKLYRDLLVLLYSEKNLE